MNDGIECLSFPNMMRLCEFINAMLNCYIKIRKSHIQISPGYFWTPCINKYYLNFIINQNFSGTKGTTQIFSILLQFFKTYFKCLPYQQCTSVNQLEIKEKIEIIIKQMINLFLTISYKILNRCWLLVDQVQVFFLNDVRSVVIRKRFSPNCRHFLFLRNTATPPISICTNLDRDLDQKLWILENKYKIYIF